MRRRDFLKSVCVAGLGSAAFVFTLGGCIAPKISKTVSTEKSQPWRCEHCGHLTRSGDDLANTRCPRCKRKGVMVKITEKELQMYLKKMQE
ncbi:hypothetical protein H8D64_00260 [PVC group bacterium]|nr:hypothetical protein [PVC group bacterium]